MKRVATDFIRAADEPREAAASGPRANELDNVIQPVMPWDTVDPRVQKPMVLRANARLDEMLKYIADNLPRTSKHSFALDAVREAAEREVADLLRRNRG
jgi:hypothetical protein